MERVLSGFYRILAGVLGALFLALTIFAVFYTVVFRQWEENDYPDFTRLPVIATLFVLIVLAFALRLFVRRFGKNGEGAKCTASGILIPERGIVLSLAAVCFFGIFLLYVIRGLPTNDARELDRIMGEFLAGDYHAMESGYLTIYPFQLSYCLAGQGLAVLFGAGSYLPYQILNLLSVLLTFFFLYETAWELTEDLRVCRVMPLMIAGCLMLTVYCTFIYNDIWSLAPLFGAFWLMIRFLKQGGMLRGTAAAVLAALSFCIKSNGSIALIAMAMMLAVCVIREFIAGDRSRAVRGLAVAVMMILFSVGMRVGVNAYYTAKSGLPVPGGVPAAAYFAMGMEETDGKCGWYNGMNARFILDADGDSDAAAHAAAAHIRERGSYLLHHPREMIRFYGKKFFSQWGDPTKVSLREQELTGRHQEGKRPALAGDLTYGTGYHILQGGMHLYHLLLCFFSAAELFALCFQKRRIDEKTVLILLFVFGGMVFHQIWEASGRYTLRYELAMMPIAAAGAVRYLAGAGKSEKRKEGYEREK
ncbi:MAG: hypothetical protein K5696_07385 [Lachnospiraceae bacterium]|nr:hypothetical protein [Lachnospiraceae bacterium]